MKDKIILFLILLVLTTVACHQGMKPQKVEDLDEGNKSEINGQQMPDDAIHQGMTQPQKPVLTRLDITIDRPEGGVSIAELFSKRNDYSGKSVMVKGQVTRVNAGIMGRNWVHLQDGTADGENFDLTVTTDDEPTLGDIIIYTGVLNLNRDFGAGYTYELILEDAQRIDD